MTSHVLPREVIRELERQRRLFQQFEDAIERIERHNLIASALRFLECRKSAKSFDECLGIYRLTPKPPPELRRAFKEALPREDYATLSRAWRAK
jgi:hypothetical protein